MTEFKAWLNPRLDYARRRLDTIIGSLAENFPHVVAGFPEMWQPVHQKYKLFFECAFRLQPIVSEMISTPVAGHLLIIVGHTLAAASNSYGAILALVLNGFGFDAVRIARSIYEAELNVLWLKNHPEDVDDFLDYNIIQQKQYYDAMDADQQKAIPKERVEEMTREYHRILPRFAFSRDKTRPRNEWCKVSIWERAKEAEAFWNKQLEADGVAGKSVSLHKAFYRPASSMHHLDIAGIIAHVDSDMNAYMAPSWEYLEDALVASGGVLRIASYYDEMATLGLGERLATGPIASYVEACKSL